MRVRTVFSAGTISLAFVLVAQSQSAHAQATATSDNMVITDPNGTQLFNFFIPEQVPGAAETTLTYDGGPVPGAPIPLGAALGIPGTNVVVLTEPATEPVDPTEIPIILNGPNGPVTVSDVVISNPGSAAVHPFIELISDGSPDLQSILSAPPAAVPITFLVETGQLQDLTPFLAPAGSPFGPIRVQVASDVTPIPEPGTAILLGLGITGLAAGGARRRVE